MYVLFNWLAGFFRRLSDQLDPKGDQCLEKIMTAIEMIEGLKALALEAVAEITAKIDAMSAEIAALKEHSVDTTAIEVALGELRVPLATLANIANAESNPVDAPVTE